MRRPMVLMTAALWLVCPVVHAQQAGDDPRQAAGEPAAQRPRRPPRRPPAPVPAGRQPGRPGSFELSASGAWLAPTALGSSRATLTSNGTSTPFTYFSAAGRMEGTAAFDARLTYNVARRVAVEGGFSASRPSVTFSITNDAENPAVTSGDGEQLQQYFVDGNVLVFLPSLTFGQGRGRAFVSGGAGYLRQLHAGSNQIDTGSVYNGGGGIKYYFRPRAKGLIKSFGLRVDLRAYYKRGGYTFDDRNTWTASLGGGAIVAF